VCIAARWSPVLCCRWGMTGTGGGLEVEVAGGAVYQYLDVPAREYFALLSADSVGRYFNQRIKPNYDFRRV
jgi:hypothetical protein